MLESLIEAGCENIDEQRGKTKFARIEITADEGKREIAVGGETLAARRKSLSTNPGVMSLNRVSARFTMGNGSEIQQADPCLTHELSRMQNSSLE
jgi:hypothetical protein